MDKQLLAISGHWRTDLRTPRGRLDLEAGIVFETPARWLRLALFWGEAPGSRMAGQHFTWWRTRLPGGFEGINVRAGVWPEPCATLLIHTHPAPRRD